MAFDIQNRDDMFAFEKTIQAFVMRLAIGCTTIAVLTTLIVLAIEYSQPVPLKARPTSFAAAVDCWAEATANKEKLIDVNRQIWLDNEAVCKAYVIDAQRRALTAS